MHQVNAMRKRPMSKLVTGVVLAAVVATLGTTTGTHAGAQQRAATVDYFLKMEGIEGESSDKSNKDQIEIESFVWGSGKQPDISFTAAVSKASPQLLLARASGTQFKEAVLAARKRGAAQQEYFRIRMSDALVSSYQISGGPTQPPTDQFTLTFGKVQMEYQQQRPDGSLAPPVIGAWEVRKDR